jgi:hypothetical protein
MRAEKRAIARSLAAGKHPREFAARVAMSLHGQLSHRD